MAEEIKKEENLEQKECRFKLLVREYFDEENQENKYSYKMVTKKGRVKVWFKTSIPKNERPTKTCFITVLRQNLSLDERFEYPIFWISKIEKVEEIEKSDRISDYLD